MKRLSIIILIGIAFTANGQERMNLDAIFLRIAADNPSPKMYDAKIRSLNEAAKGARSWDAPQISTGLWMAPYNPHLWRKQSDGATGMGQYMVSAQQMIPNKKRQDAEEKYMQSMSAVEVERKNANLNELHAAARQNYYQWIIIEKKMAVLSNSEKVLDFMIKNAELRYKNNLGKISAYYKAKASLGNIESMRIMLENEMEQKRIMLNTLMNRDKTTAFDIDTAYTINDYTNLSFDSTTFINTRSDIKAIEKDMQVIRLQQQTEKAKLKPEFGIRYDHMFGFGGFPMQYSIMGMVRLPMAKWSSRSSKAAVESLDWKAESLSQQRQMMLNEATGQSYGMRREMTAKEKQIRLFEDNIIPALRRNFQTMQLAYEQNTEELFELYDAWETLNMTQLEYLDQLQQLLLIQVELERILEIK